MKRRYINEEKWINSLIFFKFLKQKDEGESVVKLQEYTWIHSKFILPSTAYLHSAYFISPQDLPHLFGPNGYTIEALQQQHNVWIEINNRRKVNQIVMIICTKENTNNIQEAHEAIENFIQVLFQHLKKYVYDSDYWNRYKNSIIC